MAIGPWDGLYVPQRLKASEGEAPEPSKCHLERSSDRGCNRGPWDRHHGRYRHPDGASVRSTHGRVARLDTRTDRGACFVYRRAHCEACGQSLHRLSNRGSAPLPSRIGFYPPRLTSKEPAVDCDTFPQKIGRFVRSHKVNERRHLFDVSDTPRRDRACNHLLYLGCTTTKGSEHRGLGVPWGHHIYPNSERSPFEGHGLAHTFDGPF